MVRDYLLTYKATGFKDNSMEGDMIINHEPPTDAETFAAMHEFIKQGVEKKYGVPVKNVWITFIVRTTAL